MDICVIGTGYVGLVTGAMLAETGNRVVCVDRDAEKIRQLQANHLPIYEPGLDELVYKNQDEGRLRFTTDTAEGVRVSHTVFIAVGTPPAEDGSTDLTDVEAAAYEVARAMTDYRIIVVKSTVPVGTGARLRDLIAAHTAPGVAFDLVSNPEFLKEGEAVGDTFEPDRIVIGAPSQDVAMALLELYAPLERPMLITDVASAELIKYASNAFLATKISFINAMANVCERVGADVTLVAKGMGYDHRIGKEFLQAGLGYGGSCFPKDVDSLRYSVDALGEDTGLLDAVIRLNDDRTSRFVGRILAMMDGVAGRRIAVLGLAFKPNTDDVREAKSIEVIHRLYAEGALIAAYDPIAESKARTEANPPLPGDVTFCATAEEALAGADAAVIMTEWNEFKLLDWERLRSSMAAPLVFDGRNVLNVERMRRLGYDYVGIGRAPALAARTWAASR